ncbi:MAG: hypothetical protein WCJ71_11600, partial [Candidatus Omnitrophota bacterium]
PTLGQVEAVLRNLEVLEGNRKRIENAATGEQAAVEDILDYAATGAGKTIIGIATAYAWVSGQKGRKVFVATNSDVNAIAGASEAQGSFSQVDGEPYVAGYMTSDDKGNKYAWIWDAKLGMFVTLTVDPNGAAHAWRLSKQGEQGPLVEVSSVHAGKMDASYEDPVDYLMKNAHVVFSSNNGFQFYFQSEAGRHFAHAKANRGMFAGVLDEVDQYVVTDPSKAVISGGKIDHAAEFLKAEGYAAELAEKLRANPTKPSVELKTNDYEIDDQYAKVKLFRRGTDRAQAKYDELVKAGTLDSSIVTFERWVVMVQAELAAHECFINKKAPKMGDEYTGRRAFHYYVTGKVHGEDDIIPFDSAEHAMPGVHLGDQQNALRAKEGLPRLERTKTTSRMSMPQMMGLPCFAGNVLMTATGKEELVTKLAARGRKLNTFDVNGLFLNTKEIAPPSLFDGTADQSDIERRNTGIAQRNASVVAKVLADPKGMHIIDAGAQDTPALKSQLEAAAKAKGEQLVVEVYRDSDAPEVRKAMLDRAGLPGHVLLIDATLTRGINVEILEKMIDADAGFTKGLTLHLTRIHTLKIIM